MHGDLRIIAASARCVLHRSMSGLLDCFVCETLDRLTIMRLRAESERVLEPGLL